MIWVAVRILDEIDDVTENGTFNDRLQTSCAKLASKSPLNSIVIVRALGTFVMDAASATFSSTGHCFVVRTAITCAKPSGNIRSPLQ
jgi:hypothetical protein